MIARMTLTTCLELGMLAFSFAATAADKPTGRQPAQADPGPLLIGAEWQCNGATDSIKQLFYETGMNFARITGGGYSWAIPSHTQAVTELETHGVKVLLQLGSHYPSADYFKYTDSFFVDHNGGTGAEDRNVWAITYSGQAWPQYSYASESYRTQMEGDFSRYLAAFKDRTNVAGIILHNEPGLFWLKDRLFDYSPKMIAKFRTWLQQRYGQIEKLNAAWGSQFAAFDVVDPPRQLPPVDNLAAWLDWRRAQTAVIHDFLQWEIASTKRAWPGMPLTTNLAGPLESWFPIRCADNFLFTEGMDAAGIDIYPETWFTRHFSGYTMDLTRGVAQGRPVWVLEAQSYDEQKWANRTPQELAGMLRAEVWGFIGHGARAISLWAWSGRGGWNLTAGQFNPRVAAMREIAHLSSMLQLGNFQKPRRQVAVVVDPDSFFYYGGSTGVPPVANTGVPPAANTGVPPAANTGVPPAANTGVPPVANTGGTPVLPDLPWFLDKTGPGMVAALADAGYEADVLFADQIRRGVGCEYRVVVLTVPVMADDVLARRLDEFVRGGGLLIAEAPLAEVDLAGRAVAAKPGFGLDTLFGVHVLSTGTANVKPPKVGNISITAATCRSELESAGAQVIGTFPDGKPAVTANSVGKGSAIFIATSVSLPYGDGWAEPGLSTFLKSRIEPLVHAPIAIKHAGTGFLDAQFLADAKGNLALVLAVPPDKGVPPAPVTDVEISFETTQVKGLAGVCLLPPGTTRDRKVRHVPELLAADTKDGLTAKVRIPSVDSAAIVLFARDVPPILGIEAPAAVTKGAEFSVTVACLNLSPKPVAGSIDLVLPAGCRNLTGAQPSGQQTYTFRVQAPAEPQRAVIKASFIPGNAPPEARIVSVPVDVAVQ